MIITALPDPCQFSSQSSVIRDNAVIYAFTTEKYYYPDHVAPYLFVTNYLNPGNYRLNRQPITANARCFYFLNAGDKLEITFKKAEPLQTLLIFFTPDFIKNSITASCLSNEELLDNPYQLKGADFIAPPVPFHINSTLQEKLTILKSHTLKNKIAPDHLLSDILADISLINQGTRSQIGKIKAVKASTREEIYKRLTIAKIFMEENCCQRISNEEIAAEACLNSFHFLRAFKKLYGITPHQFLIKQKMDKAYHYLKNSHYPVSEVCDLTGFESIGSFSLLFKKTFGISPSALL